MNELVILEVETLNPVEIFVPDGVKAVVDKIRAAVKSEVLDASTADGRKRIASLARKIASSKTTLDDMGKSLTEEWKTKAKVVDNERKYARDQLDVLRDEIRAPLTEWEKADEERATAHKNIICEVEKLGSMVSANWQMISVETMRARLEETKAVFEGRDFQEFQEMAAATSTLTIETIANAIGKRSQYDAEQAELAQLRAEREARDKADRERQEAEEKAMYEKNIAENARRIAEDAASKAIAAAKAAQEKAEYAAKNQAIAAAAAERQKIEDEKRREMEAAAKREANKKHRQKIDVEAITALSVAVEHLVMGDCQAIIAAIADGKIPHVKINY